MTVTQTTTKAKSKNEKNKLESRVFYDKPAVSSRKSTSDTIIAQSRIGLQQVSNNVVVTEVIEDSTITGVKVGNITILGEQSSISDVDFFRHGKDIKSLKHLLSNKLTPNITLGKENDITSDDHVNHDFELTSYGQNSLFKTYDHKNKRIIPFDDIEGKPDFASFIGKTELQKSRYPYVYDSRRNYDKFRDPDPASLDGAIEVFHVRSSPVNTGFWDLQIKGARGLYGVGNWELTQHTTYGKKGSPTVSEIHEHEQSSCDFFEDAAESILAKSVDGFISEGKYAGVPFKEDDKFKNSYAHISISVRKTLLSGSIRNDSEIGTRFKSRDNGFIITPFYPLTENRSFGTDSLAFRGLLKG